MGRARDFFQGVLDVANVPREALGGDPLTLKDFTWEPLPSPTSDKGKAIADELKTSGMERAMDVVNPIAGVAGTISKAAPHLAKQAQGFIDDGLSPDEVKTFLGTWKGPDGQWRQWFDPGYLKDSMANMAEGIEYTLDDIVDHGHESYNALKQQMPGLFGTKVQVDSTLKGMGQRSRAGGIKVNPSKGGNDVTLAHEVQHEVQNLMGLSRGTSVKGLKDLHKAGSDKRLNEAFDKVWAEEPTIQKLKASGHEGPARERAYKVLYMAAAGESEARVVEQIAKRQFGGGAFNPKADELKTGDFQNVSDFTWTNN